MKSSKNHSHQFSAIEPEFEEKKEIPIAPKTEETTAEAHILTAKVTDTQNDQYVTAVQFEKAINELKHIMADQFRKLREEIQRGRSA